MSKSKKISEKKWTDKILYWSWPHDVEFDEEGNELCLPSTPTVKKIDYAHSLFMRRKDNSTQDYVLKDKQVKLAIGVWDDERYTAINRDELSCYMTTYCFDSDTDKPLHAVVIKKPNAV